MKSNRFLTLAAITTVVLGTTLAVWAASKRAKPPGPEQVAGTWLGFSVGRGRDQEQAQLKVRIMPSAKRDLRRHLVVGRE